MKFFEKMSVTKLVFLILMICLCIFTGWQYFIGHEITIKLWDTAITACISFYFGQKSIPYTKPDSLIKKDKEDLIKPEK